MQTGFYANEFNTPRLAASPHSQEGSNPTPDPFSHKQTARGYSPESLAIFTAGRFFGRTFLPTLYETLIGLETPGKRAAAGGGTPKTERRKTKFSLLPACF
jgi:hypothetical protein